MTTVYVYVTDTMADWELSYIMAELNSKRFFKKDAKDVVVKTVSYSANSVRSMGGLNIKPDLTLEEIVLDENSFLILPGSDRWSEPENYEIISVAKKFLEQGLPVAAICGATVALANAGLLDNRKHTSNGNGFLNMFCPEYKGRENYVDVPAVIDRNLITAAATGGLMMAKIILEYLDVFKATTLEHWYAYFNSGDANEFFAMMQSLQ